MPLGALVQVMLSEINIQEHAVEGAPANNFLRPHVTNRGNIAESHVEHESCLIKC